MVTSALDVVREGVGPRRDCAVGRLHREDPVFLIEALSAVELAFSPTGDRVGLVTSPEDQSLGEWVILDLPSMEVRHRVAIVRDRPETQRLGSFCAELEYFEPVVAPDPSFQRVLLRHRLSDVVWCVEGSTGRARSLAAVHQAHHFQVLHGGAEALIVNVVAGSAHLHRWDLDADRSLVQFPCEQSRYTPRPESHHLLKLGERPLLHVPTGRLFVLGRDHIRVFTYPEGKMLLESGGRPRGLFLLNDTQMLLDREGRDLALCDIDPPKRVGDFVQPSAGGSVFCVPSGPTMRYTAEAGSTRHKLSAFALHPGCEILLWVRLWNNHSDCRTELSLWDVGTRSHLRTLDLGSGVLLWADFSAAGDTVAAHAGDHLYFWSVPWGALLKKIGPFSRSWLSPDRRGLIAEGPGPGPSGGELNFIPDMSAFARS